MSTKESPIEPFKRALAHATRALSRETDVEVTYTADNGGASGKRISLPHPPRDLAPAELARLRGQADAAALRIAHHDVGAHTQWRPEGDQARALFDAAEQARVESIGARAMEGVAQNLDAALNEACEKKGFSRMEDRQDAPLAEALGLLVRERLTDRPLPVAARGVANLWRDLVYDKANGSLERLIGVVDDQKQFAQIARELIRELDLGDEIGADPTDQDDDGDP
jgi:cobaltochelatase CobT